MEYTEYNRSIYPDYDQYGLFLLDLPYGNLTALLDSVKEEHDVHSSNIVIFAIVLSILSLLINAILIIVILTSDTLRYQSSYLCIANISIVNSVLSIFVTPLAVHLELKTIWDLGHTTCAVWIIMDVLLPFVTMLILLTMSLDSLIYTISVEFYRKTETITKMAVLIILPWVIAITTVVPLWIMGRKPLPEIDGVCIYGLEEEAALASPLITYFVPTGMIVITITISIANILRQNDIDEELTASTYMSNSSSLERNKRAHFSYNGKCSIGTVCLASSLFVAMWFPHQFVCILLTYCDNCFPPYSVIMGFTWLGASTSLFVPFTFLDQRLRCRLRTFYWFLVGRLCTREDDDEDEDTETHLIHTQARSSI
ncbi:hypothetical protein FSP39_001468 [Pinctada imbricata]|uniref:G-protein coupled receptors family 1 profile domain-containing protein n=1 Tax=Pinctada imbricata TaxID=66713 RepID=A0AA89CAH0_PINIB|nr:hypothetical protein FSP39_001468 [Pinctada imbricata]